MVDLPPKMNHPSAQQPRDLLGNPSPPSCPNSHSLTSSSTFDCNITSTLSFFLAELTLIISFG